MRNQSDDGTIKSETACFKNSITLLSKFFFFVALIGGFIVGPVKMAESADKIVLKAITAFPKSNAEHSGVQPFIDMVKEKSNGRLQINWIGGPEVVNSFDQAEALSKGVVDMLLYIPTGYFRPFSPIFQAKGLSQLSTWDERTSGAYDFWVKVFRDKANAEYLGSFQCLIPFKIFMAKKPIAKLDDLQGLKIRVMPLYTPFLKALNAKPISIPPTEIYTAMQRGVVDGFMWPYQGIPTWGWHEVFKYVINPGVFSMDPATVVNRDKFKSLPPDLQKVLKTTMQTNEGVDAFRTIKRVDEETNYMLANGIEEITLPPAEAKKFVDTAYEVTWDTIIAQEPELGAEIKRLSTKKSGN